MLLIWFSTLICCQQTGLDTGAEGLQTPLLIRFQNKSVCLILKHILFSHGTTLLKKKSQLVFAYASCLLTITVALFDQSIFGCKKSHLFFKAWIGGQREGWEMRARGNRMVELGKEWGGRAVKAICEEREPLCS